jgi:hypothetical protein
MAANPELLQKGIYSISGLDTCPLVTALPLIPIEVAALWRLSTNQNLQLLPRVAIP